jgi:hypothetical protein
MVRQSQPAGTAATELVHLADLAGRPTAVIKPSGGERKGKGDKGKGKGKGKGFKGNDGDSKGKGNGKDKGKGNGKGNGNGNGKSFDDGEGEFKGEGKGKGKGKKGKDKGKAKGKAEDWKGCAALPPDRFGKSAVQTPVPAYADRDGLNPAGRAREVAARATWVAGATGPCLQLMTASHSLRWVAHERCHAARTWDKQLQL